MNYLTLSQRLSPFIPLLGMFLISPLVNASSPPQPSTGTIEIKVDPNGILRQANPQLSLIKANQIIVCLVKLEGQKTQCFPDANTSQTNCQNDFNCIINQVSFPDQYMGVILLSEQSQNPQNNIIGSGICSLDAPCILGTTQVNFKVSNISNINDFDPLTRRLYQYYNQQRSNPKTAAFAQYLIHLGQNNQVIYQNQDLYRLILQTITEDIENNPKIWSNPSAYYAPDVSPQLCQNIAVNSLNYRNCWYNITLHHHIQRHLRPALETYLYQSLKNKNNFPVVSSTNIQNELTNLQSNYQQLIQIVILSSLNQNTIIDKNMNLSLQQSIPLTLQGLYQETIFLTLQKLAQEGEISASEIARLMTASATKTDLNFSRSSANSQILNDFPLWNSQESEPLW